MNQPADEQRGSENPQTDVLDCQFALTLAQLRTDSRREAMQSVIETPRTLAHQMATETSPLPDREATLRLVTSP